jgi:hypothetical protein
MVTLLLNMMVYREVKASTVALQAVDSHRKCIRKVRME